MLGPDVVDSFEPGQGDSANHPPVQRPEGDEVDVLDLLAPDVGQEAVLQGSHRQSIYFPCRRCGFGCQSDGPPNHPGDGLVLEDAEVVRDPPRGLYR